MEEKPIKTELINEANLEISNFADDKTRLKEDPEKDIPDFVNVNNFAGTIPEEELREIYFCNYCKNRYGKFEYLQIHEYIHDPKKYCPICNFTFAAKKNFIVHINGHIKEKMEDERRSLFCDFCKKTFKKKRALTLHLRVHTNERPYKCHICGKAFKQKGSLTDHNITHTDIKAFPCEVCSGSFTTASSLRRHIKRIHDAGKTYSCKICSQKVDNYPSLQVHRAEHHPEASERRKCRLCPMVFKSLYSFNKHKKEHESNGEFVEETPKPKLKFECLLCGEKLQNFKSYAEHKNGHFNYSKEDFQKARAQGLFSCKLCQRDFENKEGLFKHMSFHMENTVKCNICHEFFSYYGYSCHKRRVHLPLECKICKEIVQGTGKLIRHYRTIHPDLNRIPDGEYVCHICGKPYKSKYPLDMHMQIFHGKSEIIKTHKCNTCGRQFTTRGTLGAHMTRVHPTSARFKCDPCNVLFQSRSKLLRHNTVYHPEIPKKYKKNTSHLCTHCNQMFRTASLLKHHRKTRHKVKPTTKFQCKICLKYFKSFKNRAGHLENKVCTKFFEKTKKDLYKCTICQRNFAFRISLFGHMAVHSNFSRTCRFCNKSFAKTPNLRKHIENRHPNEKLYYCGFCNMEFDNFVQFRIHGYSSTHRAKMESKTEVVEDTDVKDGIDEEKMIKDDVEVKKEPVD